MCPNVVEALEDAVFGDQTSYEPQDLHPPPPAMAHWVTNRVLIESGLREMTKTGKPPSATPSAVANVVATLPDAVNHPLRSGILRLELNLKQRMAALRALRDERDYAFLRDRAQYVRALPLVPPGSLGSRPRIVTARLCVTAVLCLCRRNSCASACRMRRPVPLCANPCEPPSVNLCCVPAALQPQEQEALLSSMQAGVAAAKGKAVKKRKSAAQPGDGSTASPSRPRNIRARSGAASPTVKEETKPDGDVAMDGFGSAGDSSSCSDTDSEVAAALRPVNKRSSAFSRVAAFADAAPSEMALMQNLSLRARLTDALTGV